MIFENVPCVVIRARETPEAFRLMLRITGTKSGIHHKGKIIWADYRQVFGRDKATPIFKAVWKAALQMQAPPP